MNVQLRDPADLARLVQLVRQSDENAKQRDRYRVVLLAAVGLEGVELERRQIVSITGRSRAFVDTWVKRYRTGGIDNLRPLKQPGRKPFLDEQEQRQLAEAIDAGPQAGTGPQPGAGPRPVFFGQDLRELIARRFGKLYSLSGTYALLNRLGYSWLCPRPHHPQRDVEAQDAFKKR